MKFSRFLCGKTGMLCLTVAMLAKLVTAGTPGKCAAPTTCDATCGSPSTPCMVRVSEDTNGATATMLNLQSGTPTANQDICVQGGTEIVWITDEEKSKLTATFGTQHPFVHTPQGKAAIFNGKVGHPVSDTTSTPGCYQYNLSHRIGTQKSKSADPKVIVKSGTGD